MSLQPDDVNLEIRNETKQVKPLIVNAVKMCGEMLFNLFKKLLKNDEHYETSSSISTISSFDTSYIDVIMIKRFDRLYDIMLCDLQNLDSSYKTRPKLQLYDDLYEFVHKNQLHNINRYIFGDEPIQNDWDLNELEVIRKWREQFDDQTEVPEDLIKIYKTASCYNNIYPCDVSMIAFAVFCFILGYDASKDFEILYIFRGVESALDPITFQHVYNSVLRNVHFHQWKFFDENAGGKDVEYFDSLMENPKIKEVCNWIFDLLTENPEVVDKLICNPFPIDQNASSEMHDIHGEKMMPSYIIQLRIFYRWMSNQLYMVFSDGYHNRISLLDDHIKRSMSCFDKTFPLKYFDDTYVYIVPHFIKVVCEYNCPGTILKTIRSVFADEKFKNLIKFCVNEQIKYQFNLTQCDDSTNSNESIGSYLNTNQINIEEIN